MADGEPARPAGAAASDTEAQAAAPHAGEPRGEAQRGEEARVTTDPTEVQTIRQGIWQGIDDRLGFSAVLMPILRHPVPPGTGWWYVLGSATLFSFIVQVVTGIALATVYIDSAGQAYNSLVYITDHAFLGRVLRGIHDVGASVMVILIGLHAIRVFVFGSYKFPREINWLSGVGLLFMTLGMAFTGQLLRWDQNGFWTVVIFVQQTGRLPWIGTWIAQFLLGGNTVGGATLSRFYAWHVFWIPALIFALIGIHLYLVLQIGISEPPRMGRPVDPKTYMRWYRDMLHRVGVPFWPDAAWRDVVFGVGIITLTVVIAVIFGPITSLVAPPDPTLINATPRPDWYFNWYFGVLALTPALVENYVIILGPLCLAALLIAIPFLSNHGERHPFRRPWTMGAVMITVLLVGVYTVQGTIAPWSPRFDAQPLRASAVGATSGPVADGAKLFHDKGCEFCHTIDEQGGLRGPDLSNVADRLTTDELTIRIMNGGTNMPSFANILTPQETADIVAFLETRTQKLHGSQG